jgi:hypothetical protein
MAQDIFQGQVSHGGDRVENFTGSFVPGQLLSHLLGGGQQHGTDDSHNAHGEQSSQAESRRNLHAVVLNG